METQIKIKHIKMLLQSDFEAFTERLEKFIVNTYNEVEGFHNATGNKHNLNSEAVEPGLMIYKTDNFVLPEIHGKPRYARQYQLGNPAVSTQMMNYHVGAALYTPIKLLVYEDEELELHADYDLPSSTVAQLGSRKINEIAKELDREIKAIITASDIINAN